MPQLKRDAREEFDAAHLPGARFFDIDAIADQGTSLPHMLPAAPSSPSKWAPSASARATWSSCTTRAA